MKWIQAELPAETQAGAPQWNQSGVTQRVQLPGCRMTEAPQRAVKAGPEACCRARAVLSHLSPGTAMNCGVGMEIGRSVCVDAYLNSTSVSTISAFHNTKCDTDMQKALSTVSPHARLRGSRCN